MDKKILNSRMAGAAHEAHESAIKWHKSTEVLMLNEIFNSYTYPPVAEAAVRSLGPAFAHQVKVAGRAHGLTIGGYASRAVKRFDECASPATRQALEDALRTADQPILAGIAFVLELAMDDDEEVVIAAHRTVAPRPEVLFGCAC